MKELNIPIAMATKVKCKSEKSIGIEKKLNALIRYNNGYYKKNTQKWFFLKTIQRNATPFSKFEFGYQEEKVEEKLLEVLTDIDMAIVYQPKTWQDNHNRFWNIYILRMKVCDINRI